MTTIPAVERTADRATPRPPSAGAVFRAQLALIAAPPRRGVWVALALVLAQIVALGAAGIVFGFSFDLEADGAKASSVVWTHVSDLHLGFALDEGTAAALAAGLIAVAWGFLWPFRVWRDEPPSRRGYHRAMPVERRRHDLLRVAAGAVWLLAVSALLLVAALATALLSGHAGGLGALPATAWLAAFTAPLLVYLLVSIASVRCEHPAAWVWGTLALLAPLWSLLSLVGLGAAAVVVTGRLGLHLALGGDGPNLALLSPPAFTRWVAATLLWLALAAAGVWAAAARRDRSS
jgi:uncharacterized membrane protein YhdT